MEHFGEHYSEHRFMMIYGVGYKGNIPIYRGCNTFYSFLERSMIILKHKIGVISEKCMERFGEHNSEQRFLTTNGVGSTIKGISQLTEDITLFFYFFCWKGV